ncbi:MAG: hypothetical protein ACOC1G_01050 [Phycisphaeraceae bacterium]
MNLDNLRERLRRQPFKPFRVHLSDGKSYDVLHPEMMLLTKSWVSIAIYDETPDRDAVPDRDVHISPMHITSTEDLPEKQSAA